MEPGPPLLALRLGDLSHALEPGRDYLLGSADDCDLRLPAAAPHQAQVSVATDQVALVALASEPALFVNGCPLSPAMVASASLQGGDVITIGDPAAPVGIATVVADDGTATLVPIPAMRQAAVARRMAAVRVAAARLRHRDDQTFQELIAHELRRTPWLATSLVLHLLLLLLLWWLTPPQQVGGRSVATIAIDVPAGGARGEGNAVVPDIIVEPDEDEILQDPEPPTPESQQPDHDGAYPRPFQPPSENFKLAARRRASSAGNGATALQNENGIGSGSFQQTVAELQESGLEIVFVFDSTGSMTRTIHDTKTSIVQMLDVLRSLVPDARIGLVTYRDRSPREDYLVRQVSLDLDYWRASNFVQFVVAEGGGDRPEDVRAGLNAAFQQHWRGGARRVVVLAGDAPPHADDFSQLLTEVRAFARDKRSFVHALVTSPERAGDDTHAIFAEIAEAGHGISAPLQDRDRVLQRVLTLAFGAGFDRDIQAVIQSVEKERDRVDTASLHLVRRGGQALVQALLQRPVPPTLCNALVKRPRRAVATVLIDLLGDEHTPAHTQNAAAAALQVMLALPVPPIDIETGEPLSQQRLTRLRLLAERLPE